MTGKKPAVAIIVKSKNDEKYIKRIETVDKNIKIAIIYSKNQVFTINPNNSKNLHNRYEGEFFNISELDL